jgi:hypothetical protein
MACMVQNSEWPLPAVPAIIRLAEDDWRGWRDIRLAALADSPSAFGSVMEDEQTIEEDGWRKMVRDAAIFTATAGDRAAGVVAGLYRDSARDRGLGAMWVAPAVARPRCCRDARSCGCCLESIRGCGQGRTVGAGRQHQSTPVL